MSECLDPLAEGVAEPRLDASPPSIADATKRVRDVGWAEDPMLDSPKAGSPKLSCAAPGRGEDLRLTCAGEDL